MKLDEIKKTPEKIIIIEIKKTGLKLNKGESIIFKTGGGGGYGDPIERSNKKILNDLKQEYISKEYVEKHYPQFKS